MHARIGKPRIIGWRRNGAPIYEIKGASPDDASNDTGDSGQDSGAGDDAGDAGDGGEVDKDSSENEQTSGQGASGTDWEKEAARLRSELAKARKWEKQAKSNADAAKRLGEVEEQQKSAEQRAQDAARKAEERAQAAAERVAKAEIKAALTGVVDDPDSIIEDLSIKRFLADDEPDDDAIAALKAKYEALRPPTKRAPNPNPAQGVNGSKEHEKPYTQADLARMSTDEINEARKAGKLDHLMGRKSSK